MAHLSLYNQPQKQKKEESRVDFRKILAKLASERPVFRSKEDFEQTLHNLLSRYYRK
jgi:hypothetical protein